MSETHSESLSLVDYLAIARRHAVLIAVSFFGILLIGVAAAVLVPPVYQSTGTILIESQQIPVELVQASVTSYAEERIEITKQRVMTRENLLRIIAKYKLFQDSMGNFTPSEQIDQMRRDTQVELIQANLKNGQRGTGTIAFKLSFDHRRPEVAQSVANELVTLFLGENVKVRTERATQTTEFLKQESARLRLELDKLETQIAAYKQEHGRALPENTAMAMTALQRLETDLRQTERDIRAGEEELRYLEVERSTASSMPTAQAPPGSTASGLGGTSADLPRMRTELARLLSMYTENHPDVRSLQRRIDKLEAAGAGEKRAASAPVEAVKDPVQARLDSRIAGVRSRIALLTSQQAALRGRMSQLDNVLAGTPQVERGLSALTRDYQMAQRKYEEIRSKQTTAQVAENLEGEQKAERFALLEAPAVPEKPIRPDRKKFLAMGFAFSLAGSAGLVILMEMLHGAVRGYEPIAALMGQRPLVAIPFIPVAVEAAQRRRLQIILAGASCALLLAILGGLHFAYMPLDMLVAKVMFRLS
jgi:succinoglycan biosynthesis transport protein ExoP